MIKKAIDSYNNLKMNFIKATFHPKVWPKSLTSGTAKKRSKMISRMKPNEKEK